jgi:hypothetical protein
MPSTFSTSSPPAARARRGCDRRPRDGGRSVDLKRAQGAIGRDDGTLPLRLGNETTGVVTGVGPDAAGFEGEPLTVGEEVFGH